MHNPICALCWWGWGGWLTDTDLQIDHYVPLSSGGAAYDRANLWVLCRDCHNRKNTLEPSFLQTAFDAYQDEMITRGLR